MGKVWEWLVVKVGEAEASTAMKKMGNSKVRIGVMSY